MDAGRVHAGGIGTFARGGWADISMPAQPHTVRSAGAWRGSLVARLVCMLGGVSMVDKTIETPPPGPLRGRGRRPSGAVGRRPSVRPNRNTLKVKEPPLRTAQTVMGMSPTGIGRRLPRAPGMLGAFWVRMEACWTAKLLMCAQNVRQRRPFLFVSRGFENEGRLWRTFIVKAVLIRL